MSPEPTQDFPPCPPLPPDYSNPSRGILLGMVIGSVMWAVLILIIWAFKGD